MFAGKPERSNRAEEIKDASSFSPPLYHQASGPQGKLLGGRESSVDIIRKPKQGGGGEQTKTHKNPCLQLCTQSQGPGGVARKQGLCGGGSVCKCHVCMYAIHGLFNSTVHRGVARPRSPKCNLPLGQMSCGDKLREGPRAKLPGFRKGARVCYRFFGGLPSTCLI